MSEYEQQCALFEWAKAQEPVYPELKWMFAIPNGGNRPKRKDKYGRWYSPAANKLKRSGAKAGVLDICLPVSNDDHIGLWIEMKWGYNKPSDEQREWIAALTELGHRVVVCYDWEAAKTEILEYLGYAE